MKHSRTLISVFAGSTTLLCLTLLAVTSAGAQDSATQAAPASQDRAPIGAPQRAFGGGGQLAPMQAMPQMMMGGHVDQMVVEGRSLYVAYDGKVVKLNKDTLAVEAQVQLPGTGMRPMGGMPPQPQRSGGGFGGGAPARPGGGGGFGGGGSDQPSK